MTINSMQKNGLILAALCGYCYGFSGGRTSADQR